MLFDPASFIFLIRLIALLTSIFCGVLSAERSLCAVSMSGVFIGTGLRKISSNYFTPRFAVRNCQ